MGTQSKVTLCRKSHIQRQVLQGRILKQVYGWTIKNYAMYRVASYVYLKTKYISKQRQFPEHKIFEQVYGHTTKN